MDYYVLKATWMLLNQFSINHNLFSITMTTSPPRFHLSSLPRFGFDASFGC